MSLKDFVKLLRVNQWYKNLVIFIGIVFSGNLLNITLFSKILLGFVTLCLYSSTIYIINDIKDIEKDKMHPEKRKRPIASGKISIINSIIIAIIIFLLGSYISYSINFVFFIVSLSFVLLGLLYTFILKHIFLVDAVTVGINFILRAALGAIAINVMFSSWLIICTFLLALVLVFSKRLSENKKMKQNAKNHRKVLHYYDNKLTSNLLNMSIISLYISYLIYAVMYDVLMSYTIPIVTFILFRFMHLFSSKLEKIEQSEKILKDNHILAGILLWIISVLVIIYVF